MAEKGILRDAFYEALYPAMFKTLIPIACINTVRKGINKQKMLEDLKNENAPPQRNSVVSFVSRLFGAEAELDE